LALSIAPINIYPSSGRSSFDQSVEWPLEMPNLGAVGFGMTSLGQRKCFNWFSMTSNSAVIWFDEGWRIFWL
jgi:hypothetical protein